MKARGSKHSGEVCISGFCSPGWSLSAFKTLAAKLANEFF